MSNTLNEKIILIFFSDIVPFSTSSNIVDLKPDCSLKVAKCIIGLASSLGVSVLVD